MRRLFTLCACLVTLITTPSEAGFFGRRGSSGGCANGSCGATGGSCGVSTGYYAGPTTWYVTPTPVTYSPPAPTVPSGKTMVCQCSCGCAGSGVCSCGTQAKQSTLTIAEVVYQVTSDGKSYDQTQSAYPAPAADGGNAWAWDFHCWIRRK